jgi:hypothetical protein
MVALQLCTIEERSQSLMSIVYVFATKSFFFVKSKIIKVSWCGVYRGIQGGGGGYDGCG